MQFHKHNNAKTHETYICPWWLSFMLNNNIRKVFQDPYKLFCKFIHDGQSAADIGCGPGFFTLDIARLVGDTGKVIAVDIQQRMLDILKHRAIKEKIEKRIIFQKAGINKIGIKGNLDFILLFYMAHEVQDIKSLFAELKSHLNSGGILFLCEPKLHVSRKKFLNTIQTAYDIGFIKHSDYKVFGSRTILLTV
jgi:ubiquinone/menaquinone biosynthesis C-methylase UbiE